LPKRVWVFDLDGTLMDTTDLYNRPIEKASVLIIEALGDKSPSLQEIKIRQNKIDCGLLRAINPLTKRPYLYAKQRFPTSFVETYKELSRELGVNTNCAIERRLYSIGLETYDKKQYMRKIKPCTLPLAKFLHHKGDVLLILTKGDRRIQGDKRRVLEKMGIMKYFKEFIIAPDKKDQAFKEIMRCYRGDRYYSIGDTYKADIVPAIKAGYFGIYIPSHLNWLEFRKLGRIEKLRSKQHSNHYSSLIEIKEKYNHL